MIFIFVTFPKKQEANKICLALLKNKLIACFSLFPIESSYVWKSKIVHKREVQAILKTTEKNYKPIENYILKNHSYDTPEIAAVHASDVNHKYLDWLVKETK